MSDSDRLSDAQFGALAALVQRSVGIQLPASKRIMVEGRLRKRVRALGLPDLASYAGALFERGLLDQEFDHLVDCVTTNKTDFFREPAHFEFLREVAVPHLARSSGRPALKIWSAACSTGAEAYSVAMVLQDLVDLGRSLRYAILGTDISTEVLREARAAIYPSEFVEAVPAAMRQRYVMQARDPRQACVRIAPELRRQVRFERLNLMEASYPFDRDVDIVFCRNVLIYFDKPTQAAVLARLAGHLRPGGYLLLGHSESMAGASLAGMSQIAPSIYQAQAQALKGAPALRRSA